MVGTPFYNRFINTYYVSIGVDRLFVVYFINKEMVKQAIKCSQDNYKREGFKMPDPFAVYKFADCNSGPCQKLFDCVKDTLVKMKKAML